MSGALASLVLASTLFAVVGFHDPVPRFDEWENLARIWSWVLAGHPLSMLFYQHNEHIIFFPNIFFFADYALFHGQHILMVSAAVAFLGMQACLYGFLLRRAVRDRWFRSTAFCTILIITFSLRQLDAFFWHFELQFVMVFFASAASCFAFGRAVASDRAGKAPWPALLLATGSAAVATFSMANGFLVDILLVAMALWLRAPLRLLVATSSLMALLVAGFFSDYAIRKISGNAADHLSAAALAVLFGRFLTGYLGNIDAFSLRLSQAVGLWGLLLTVGAVVRTARSGRDDAVRATLLAVMFFVIGSGVLTALGRMYDGSGNALAPRYVTAAVSFWSAHVVFWTLELGGGCLSWPRSGSAAYLGSIAVLCAGALAAQLLIWPELRGLDRDLRHATDALLTDVYEDAAIEAIYDDGSIVRPSNELLRQHRLSIFSAKGNDLLFKPLAWAGRDGVAGACIGSIDALRPMGGSGAFTVEGRAWDIAANTPFDRIWLVDDAGMVVGYASGRGNLEDSAAWWGYARPRGAGSVGAVARLPDRTLCRLGGQVPVGRNAGAAPQP